MDLALFLWALKIMFCNLGSPTTFQNFHFFSTPLRGGVGGYTPVYGTLSMKIDEIVDSSRILDKIVDSSQ